ncbi:hypothetical protein P9747_30500, partial [Paenibacillus macerans]|uniref:hypothetical protein n=1 Tax=Paenibacillus macerans TaxID=44252 RepID=UPI002E1BE168|nr:hypothetical protein [Paenibacillus macerans]
KCAEQRGLMPAFPKSASFHPTKLLSVFVPFKGISFLKLHPAKKQKEPQEQSLAIARAAPLPPAGTALCGNRNISVTTL